MQTNITSVLSLSSSLASLTRISRCCTANFLPITTTSAAVFKRTKKTVATTSPENACKATGAIHQPGKGKIYDKKPFKFTCIAGKSYLWCTCGWSKTQPFCDSTHKNTHYRISLKPIRFIPRETKEYIFCNCKQTNNRPFCDGTHKREDIQAAVKS